MDYVTDINFTSHINPYGSSDKTAPPLHANVEPDELEQPAQAQTALYSEIIAANKSVPAVLARPFELQVNEPNVARDSSSVDTRFLSHHARHLLHFAHRLRRGKCELIV